MKNTLRMTQQQFIDFAQRQRPALLLTAKQYLSAVEDAEDAVQEVLMKLWSARERIDNADDFSKYALTSVRNTALNILNEQKRRQTVSIDIHEVPNETHGPDTRLEALERQQHLDNIISHMPVASRTLLKMRNIDQLSYSQIALMLGTTETAIRIRVSRIRQQLVNQIKTITHESPRNKPTDRALPQRPDH